MLKSWTAERYLLLRFLNEPRATILWFSNEMRLRTLKKIAKFCREYMCFSLENLAQESLELRNPL
jgi:hypothetical protein